MQGSLGSTGNVWYLKLWKGQEGQSSGIPFLLDWKVFSWASSEKSLIQLNVSVSGPP